MRAGSARPQRGFTFVAVLAAMFLLALATQEVVAVASQESQREREQELIRIGTAYAEAVRSYHESSPGSARRWPRSLEELVEDKRFVGTRRHIREIYDDPVARSAQWGLIVAPDGGIAGVHSLSEAQPIRTAAFEAGSVMMQGASRYSDWKFAWTGVPAGQER